MGLSCSSIKEFLIFQEMETIKKFLIFSQKNAFPIFSQKEAVLILQETETPKKFLIFLPKNPPKYSLCFTKHNFLIFQ